MSVYKEACEIDALRTRQKNIPFRDGVLSMKGNSGVYSTPMDNSGIYTHVEVAYLVGKGKFRKIDELKKYDIGDDTYPQVPLKDILMILKTQMLSDVHDYIETIKERYNKPLTETELEIGEYYEAFRNTSG
jgi:hypothetical protein|tara:strand:- start:7380 stop:7772 length:393 start_codon:yes stop_codon:yes gene_type:complete